MKTDIKREMRRLITLRADNVLEVFNRQLNIYKVTHSDSVIVDGETLNGMQRGMFLLLGRNDKDGLNTAKNIEISDVDKNGIPLTLERFINNQLKRYEPLYLETIGSRQYDAENAKLKLYIDFLKSYKIDEKKDDEYKDLKEIFIYPETYDDCINVLKDVHPPILNIENKYIGKEKGAFVLWIDYLNRNNLIYKSLNDKDYSRLISKAFDFPISEGLFRKVSKRAMERYDADFKQLLSQVYQSVKT